MEESIRRWNPWWAGTEELDTLTGIERDVTTRIAKTLDLPQIKDIIGVRRSGKTTMMYQMIRELIRKGTKPKDIVFLNFDDPEINSASFEDLLKAIDKINPSIECLFLDEIQQKKEWERWLRTIYDTRRFRCVFVSGSSSSLLSQDIGRVLTGRHLTFRMFPFSFREYLVFSGWEKFTPDFLKHNKNKLLHYLGLYLKGGGFPEVAGKNDFERETILTNIYNDILARDIAARFNASYEIVKKISHHLLTNTAKEFSLRSIANALGLSVETVEKYIGFLKESFILLVMDVFSYKTRVQFRQNKKAYSVDTGLRNAVSFRFSEDMGRLAENVVFAELKRRESEAYYWKDRNGREVDFVVKEGLNVKKLIQVCWNINDEKTKEREVRALLEAMKYFRLKNSAVITEDYEGEEVIEGKTIRYVPLWAWLLAI